MKDDIPGVHHHEISSRSPSIKQVATAIPAFIGYTQNAEDVGGEDLTLKPKRVTSLFEFESFFGDRFIETNLKVTINGDHNHPSAVIPSIENRSKFIMHYAMQMYFGNGGGPCWIVSVGDHTNINLNVNHFLDGLKTTENIDEITLYVYPEAQGLSNPNDFYTLLGSSLDLCAKLMDRFTIMDIWQDPGLVPSAWMDNILTMRTNSPNDEDRIKYGATYFPNLETTLDYYYGGEGTGDTNVTIEGCFTGNLAALKAFNNTLYFRVQQELRDFPIEMPPSPGIAGIYAKMDAARGVWKAPANINMAMVIKPIINLTSIQQKPLNVDVISGKSVNAIRSFAGRGNALVWGARTLAGNSKEWRYIPVRRFFNMVEESIKKGTERFVFEPNDINTWSRVKSMIYNFLELQWRAGALIGNKPEDAFFVKVGLNETMTPIDLMEGRLIVEIGIAVVRPAEFIILKFSHKMLSSS